MRNFLMCVALAAITLVTACKTSKKNKTASNNSTASNTPAATSTPTADAKPVYMMKPSNGAYPPGNAELTAIQAQYKEVTMEKLMKGHELYTNGACVSCHRAKEIYRVAEENIEPVINNMATKAKLTEEQKDAVLKYVLAVKATQPK